MSWKIAEKLTWCVVSAHITSNGDPQTMQVLYQVHFKHLNLWHFTRHLKWLLQKRHKAQIHVYTLAVHLQSADDPLTPHNVIKSC